MLEASERELCPKRGCRKLFARGVELFLRQWGKAFMIAKRKESALVSVMFQTIF